mgnify:CR=1 FL=1
MNDSLSLRFISENFNHSRHAMLSYLDLLYSNSICKQSSMPTSILIELFSSG